jgi:DNA transposition AAA+ family ATPase
MGCFHGRAGLGKTTAGIYATNRFNACHIEALPVGGPKYLFSLIVRELGLRPAKTVTDLFEQAAASLARSGRPLILDEAHFVTRYATINLVRKLHDATGCAVILMGEDRLPETLQQWPEVHSRMLSWVGAEPATAEDVDHLAKIYARGIEIAPDLKAALLAASRGSIRNVSTNLAGVTEFAQVRGLTRVGFAEWGKTAFHTGVPPAPRDVPVHRLRRGAAA